MASKNENKKQTGDAAVAPQEDPKNYVTQTSRHPLGHLVTGQEETPVKKESEIENVTK